MARNSSSRVVSSRDSSTRSRNRRTPTSARAGSSISRPTWACGLSTTTSTVRLSKRTCRSMTTSCGRASSSRPTHIRGDPAGGHGERHGARRVAFGDEGSPAHRLALGRQQSVLGAVLRVADPQALMVDLSPRNRRRSSSGSPPGVQCTASWASQRATSRSPWIRRRTAAVSDRPEGSVATTRSIGIGVEGSGWASCTGRSSVGSPAQSRPRGSVRVPSSNTRVTISPPSAGKRLLAPKAEASRCAGFKHGQSLAIEAPRSLPRKARLAAFRSVIGGQVADEAE